MLYIQIIFPVYFLEHHIINQMPDTLSLLQQPLYCTGTEKSSLVVSIKNKSHDIRKMKGDMETAERVKMKSVRD